MIMQMEQPDPPPTHASILAKGWDFGRLCNNLSTEHVAAVIPIAKEMQIDQHNIRLLEILHATLQLFDSSGLRAETERRNKFFLTEFPAEEEKK